MNNYKYGLVAILVSASVVLFGQAVSANGDDTHDMNGEMPSGIMQMDPKPGETHHFEVKPETLDGQRIPYMTVTVTAVEDGTGTVVEKELHPMFGGGFHYGANLALPGEGYLLEFHLEPPSADLMRGSKRKDQWLEPLHFEFAFNAKEEFDHKIKIGDASTADMNILFETEHAEPMWMLMSDDMDMGAAKEKSIPDLVLLILGLLGGLIVGFVLGRK